MATLRQDLGPVTAYAFAVEKGYTGTEEEYAELMASYATVAEAAAGSASDAADSASDAEAYGAGTRGGSAVESGDEAYHNNAKYYAESAADDASTVASAVNSFMNITVPAAVQSVTDEGTTQIGLVQGEGTTQIGFVSGEGTTQVGAVEAKGAEVLESIPEDYTELSDDVSGLKSATDELNSAFDTTNVSLTLSAASAGYMQVNGTITGTENTQVKHTTVDIDSTLVGKELYISGNLWWSLLPYVFIPTSGTPVYPTLSGNGTVQKKIDMPFTPETTGTLYINYHNDNPVHAAYYKEIGNLKSSKLPNDISNKLIAVRGYDKIEPVLIQYKYLNASNGVITDTTGAEAWITDFIEVEEGDIFYITTEHFWGQGMYVWYDNGKGYISGVASANGGTLTKIWNEKVIAPTGARYLVVAEWAQTNYPPITIYKGVYLADVLSKRWTGEKWVCVGDSLTERNTKAVMHYYDYVSANTGIVPVIMGVSGSGYANNAGGSNAFYNRVSSIPSDADVITIFGSFNDLSSGLQLGTAEDSDTTTIAGCMNKTIENILSVIPTANIGIVAPTPWSGTRPTTNGASLDYVNMLQAVSERWSLPFLDLWRHSGLMPWDVSFAAVAYPSGDTVHPNDIGQQIIAPKFKAFLETLLM